VNTTETEVVEVVAENEEEKEKKEAEEDEASGYGDDAEEPSAAGAEKDPFDTLSLLQFDSESMNAEPAEVQEAEKAEGETKAQKESNALNKDIGDLKETLEDGQGAKSDNPEETETTESAIAQEKAEMKKLGMDKGSKKESKSLNGEEDPTEPEPVPPKLRVELTPGEGRRVLKMKCVQPQDPIISKTQQHVSAAQAAVDAAIKLMQEKAKKMQDAIDAEIAADKAKAAEENEKANLALAARAKDKELLKEAEAELDTLQKSMAAASDEDAKAELQDKIDDATERVAELKDKVEKASGSKERAVSEEERARQREEEEKRKLGQARRTEMHTSAQISVAEMGVEAARKKLREYTEMVTQLTNTLSDADDADDMSVREKQLLGLIREKQIFELAFKQSETNRDEVILDVGEKRKEAQARVAQGDEKTLEDLQDRQNSLKTKLATASATQKAAVQAELTEVEQKLGAAKAAVKAVENTDVLKEAAVVTKAEKATLVEEREAEVRHAGEKTKLKQQELEVAMSSLKQTKDPTMILKLTGEIATLKRIMADDVKEEQETEDKLVEAKNVDAKPGDALVAKMEGSVTEAKGEMNSLEAQQSQLEEDIGTAEDPDEVKKLSAELDSTKQEMTKAKETVVRRETKVKKVEEVVEEEKEEAHSEGYGTDGEEDPEAAEIGLTPEAAKVEARSPDLKEDMEKIENLKAKLKTANIEFAEAINHVLKTKEAKMKQRVKSLHKGLSGDELEMEAAKAKYRKVKKVYEAEGKGAHAFNKIKTALLVGDYATAEQTHEVHKATSNPNKFKRIKEEVAETRLEYSTPDPKLGMCSESICCLKSFKDPLCKDPKAKMCKHKTSNVIEEWKDMIPMSASFKEASGSVNRTMHVQGLWVSNGEKGKKLAMSLQLQICGKFTKYGNEGTNICFPQDADGQPKGVPIGEIFGAHAGGCVRSEDFVAVVKEKVKTEVKKGIVALRHEEKMKEQADKLPKPKPKIEQITTAVTRAIGGAFKGSLGGVDMQREVVAFIDESATEEWENILNIEGSFMITHEQNPNALNITTTELNSAQKKKSGSDENWSAPQPVPPIKLPPVVEQADPQ
jgi:hypothetical protein